MLLSQRQKRKVILEVQKQRKISLDYNFGDHTTEYVNQTRSLQYTPDFLLFRESNLTFFQGLLINWDTQKEIWDTAFGTAISPKDTHILITEPAIVPDSVREVQNEMLFEEYGFKAMYTTSGTTVCVTFLILYKHNFLQ